MAPRTLSSGRSRSVAVGESHPRQGRGGTRCPRVVTVAGSPAELDHALTGGKPLESPGRKPIRAGDRQGDDTFRGHDRDVCAAVKIEPEARPFYGAGHPQRIEIDCGSGAGEFTLAAARDFPETTFIGVDINRHWHTVAEAKRREGGLSNAHFIHAELMDYLTRYVPSASISGFHVYFPTPHMGPVVRTNPLAKNLRGWLVTPTFIEELRRTAVPGATLRFATDHRPYAAAVTQLIEAMGLTLLPWTEPLTSGPVDLLVGTGCEREMRRHGKDILFLQCALR